MMGDSSQKTRSIRERLEELFRRLRAMPRVENADEAFRQLCETLDAVEDEWSGVPKQTLPPLPSNSDGRMYCPLPDFVSHFAEGGILALTRGHRIEIGSDGSLRIVSKLTGQTEFEK